MKICKNCQIEFDESHNFCSRCGSKLEKIVKYETLGTEYFQTRYPNDPLFSGRIAQYKSCRNHFKRFIYDDYHYYISEMELWKEEIPTGERTLIATLDNLEKTHHDISSLFLFVNKDGIIIYSENLKYLYYYPHYSESGINYCDKVSTTESQIVSDIYISDNLIFYCLASEPSVSNELVFDEHSKQSKQIPISIAKRNNKIEKLNVITGEKEIIFSSIYLGDIYIEPTMTTSNGYGLSGNRDYLAFSVNVYNISSETDFDSCEAKDTKVLLNLNTKEIKILPTDTLGRYFLFLDARRNQIWYVDMEQFKHIKYDIETGIIEELEHSDKFDLHTYFDGVDAYYYKGYQCSKLFRNGSTEEFINTETHGDESFFKNDKWIMLLSDTNTFSRTETYLYFENGAISPTYQSTFTLTEQLISN